MTGVTTALDLDGAVRTGLQIGLTTLSVNLVATHPSMFPAGVYRAVTVVTCE